MIHWVHEGPIFLYYKDCEDFPEDSHHYCAIPIYFQHMPVSQYILIQYEGVHSFVSANAWCKKIIKLLLCSFSFEHGKLVLLFWMLSIPIHKRMLIWGNGSHHMDIQWNETNGLPFYDNFGACLCDLEVMIYMHGSHIKPHYRRKTGAMKRKTL